MVSFNFDYYNPDTLQEAVELFQQLDHLGKQPMFFSGGTELITLGRIDLVYTEAVIDIKNIPEFKIKELDEEQLILGSALSLSELGEANLFPLLSKVASEVADHTSRVKITLGGNINARIFYRETVLPFLLADSRMVIAGPAGLKTAGINDIFHEKLLLEKGEILAQIITNRNAVEAPCIAIKRRQQWVTGYPLITIAAMLLNGELRVAISGLCPFPFRSKEMEAVLNTTGFSIDEKIGRVLQILPEPILEDVEGSAEYRLFVLKHLISDVITAFGGDQI